ncbi:hypothetical protein SKAU_G00130670 [Synaphobranchus kaupii]|uniref:Uncharacterized protein n=1 Tax=Synaphobranchus kaupii TaxID=118154 RepID=A0A9Q1J2Z2_SYNKA|nr:hypothetical protein SKAU_G00130670 [Synaphobranchus kaupii]
MHIFLHSHSKEHQFGLQGLASFALKRRPLIVGQLNAARKAALVELSSCAGAQLLTAQHLPPSLHTVTEVGSPPEPPPTEPSTARVSEWRARSETRCLVGLEPPQTWGAGEESCLLQTRFHLLVGLCSRATSLAQVGASVHVVSSLKSHHTRNLATASHAATLPRKITLLRKHSRKSWDGSAGSYATAVMQWPRAPKITGYILQRMLSIRLVRHLGEGSERRPGAPDQQEET